MKLKTTLCPVCEKFHLSKSLNFVSVCRTCNRDLEFERAFSGLRTMNVDKGPWDAVR